MKVKLQYTERGYPSKWTIKILWKIYGIETEKFIFNAEFGEKRAGFLWKAHSMDERVQEWIFFAENHGVKFKRIKMDGVIHSVWFDKKD